ncbi:phospholipase A [Paucibacter sp. TC2R-5]|uniref:phospholipase A n=1 Tax=Paucibacter sp. TC2R-5 TaxID=2893555 RepID=UPI0021E3B179|nr:phospholipase A [Paucibacter sp. TC2R-5]MCV2360061.1 phospholipase A [Paucibacter sp. TC2R-5]
MHKHSLTPHRLLALLLLSSTLTPLAARADIHLLAPSRTLDPTQPFKLSLMLSAEAEPRSYALPEVLRVTLTPDLGALTAVNLRLESPLPPQIDLHPGEFLRINYVGELPANLRGRVRIDALDLDVPAMLVQLSTPTPAPTSTAAPSAAIAAAPMDAASAPAVTTLAVRADSDPNLQDQGRLSFNEPMFAAVGPGIEANAKFQISFRLRLYEPADKLSRRLVDNLYLGYTQTAFWDLTGDSKPFVDTKYKPGFFYQSPSTGWRAGGNEVGFAAGYEHESNGRDDLDAKSRSIDILYVKPLFTFGDSAGFHTTFEPKLYVYLDKDENPDMHKYRGYGDFRFTYGKKNDWQIAMDLRKGTLAKAFSADVQATYPLNRFVPGLSGYLMAQYFTGYGETLLNYNKREPWALRLGYAIWR